MIQYQISFKGWRLSAIRFNDCSKICTIFSVGQNKVKLTNLFGIIC